MKNKTQMFFVKAFLWITSLDSVFVETFQPTFQTLFRYVISIITLKKNSEITVVEGLKYLKSGNEIT